MFICIYPPLYVGIILVSFCNPFNQGPLTEVVTLSYHHPPKTEFCSPKKNLTKCSLNPCAVFSALAVVAKVPGSGWCTAPSLIAVASRCGPTAQSCAV